MTAALTDEPDLLDVLAGVAVWARPFLALPDVPPFGCPEWLALPLDDDRRAAAVVRAALAWWRVGEPLEDLEVRRRAAELVEASHDVAGATSWADLSHVPGAAELARRRDWHARAAAS